MSALMYSAFFVSCWLAALLSGWLAYFFGASVPASIVAVLFGLVSSAVLWSILLSSSRRLDRV